MGDVVQVDPQKLLYDEDRVTAQLDPEQRDALRSSIQREGVKQPLDVVDVDGQLVIADGLNRTQIALELGLEAVPAIVRKGTWKDVRLENLVANHRRGRNKPGDMARAVLQLVNEDGLSLEEIQEATGLSSAWLRKLVSLGELQPHVQEAVATGTVTVGVALELGRITDGDAQIRTFVLAQNQNWTVDHARMMVDAILREMAKPAGQRAPIELVRPPGPECAFCALEILPETMVVKTMCAGCWSTISLALRGIPPTGG